MLGCWPCWDGFHLPLQGRRQQLGEGTERCAAGAESCLGTPQLPCCCWRGVRGPAGSEQGRASWGEAPADSRLKAPPSHPWRCGLRADLILSAWSPPVPQPSHVHPAATPRPSRSRPAWARCPPGDAQLLAGSPGGDARTLPGPPQLSQLQMADN